MNVVQQSLVGASLLGTELRTKSLGEKGVDDYATGDGTAGAEDTQ